MQGLKQKRLERSMTLQQLANALGLNVKTLNHYETGRREPNLKTLKTLARYFGCYIEELI